jgi:hypothetical protein
MPQWLRRLGAWVLSQLSWTLVWWLLVAGGGAAAIAAISTAYSGIHGVLRYIFLVGVLMFGVGLIIAPVRVLLRALPSRFREAAVGPESQQRPPARQGSVRSWSDSQPNLRRDDADGRRARVAIHEVITTLEDHSAVIRELPATAREFSRSWQGDWPEGRALLAQEPRYDSAVRETERAFQTIGRVSADGENAGEALAAINAALTQLNMVLAASRS